MSETVEINQVAAPEPVKWGVAPPWTGLGIECEPGETRDSILKRAGLDWRLTSQKIFCEIDGRRVPVPGRRAIVRETDDKVMTVAGQDWKPFQNDEVLDFFSKYAEAGALSIDIVGSMRQQSVIWALARLNHDFEVIPGDLVKGYLLLTSPHRNGAAITVRTTTIRMKCANSMAIVEKEGNLNYRQSHRGDFNIEAARKSVEKAHEVMREAEIHARALKSMNIDLEDRIRVLAPFFDGADMPFDHLMDFENKTPRALLHVLNSIETAPGADPDTAWGILQGVLHYCDHVNGRSAQTRMYRSWVSDVGSVKIKVRNALLRMGGSMDVPDDDEPEVGDGEEEADAE